VKLEYRADAQYDLGDVLPAVVAEWKHLLSKAQEAANSWNKRSEKDRLGKMQQEINECFDRSQIEKWAINKTIHYTNWAKLQKGEFAPVVDAFQGLLQCFACKSCEEFAHVTPPKRSREAVRCRCGEMMNLISRS
jgi:hypothetical protein